MQSFRGNDFVDNKLTSHSAVTQKRAREARCHNWGRKCADHVTIVQCIDYD